MRSSLADHGVDFDFWVTGFGQGVFSGAGNRDFDTNYRADLKIDVDTGELGLWSGGGLLGYTDGRRITCSAGQVAHVEFATIAHETTHVLLHFARNVDGSAGARPDLTTRETEAEAVTYLLCAQLGITGTEASVEYIQSYRGTPDTLDASLERIRVTAQRLSIELDTIRFNVMHDPGPA